MPLKPTYQELMAKIESLEEELRARRQTGVPGAGEGEVGYPNLESLLHSIINNTQNVIYVKGVDGRFLLVNNNFCSIFDLREEVVIGKTPLELFPRDVAFQHLENDRRIIATGEPATFNEQAQLSDGRHTFISVKFPIRGDTGVVFAVGGISTDITERVRAEEHLRQSEERFRLAFQTSPDAINLNRAADGMYLDINEGFTRLMGYTREEVIGKTSQALNIWADPADRKRLVDELLRTGAVENLEARFVRKSGQVGMGLMSARILQIDDEAVILSVTRDITASKAAEDTLRASELKFKNIVDASPMGIHQYEIRQGDRLVFAGANAAADRLLGIRHENLMGLSIEEAFPGLRETEIPQRYREAALEGKTWQTEQIDYHEGAINGAFEVVAFQTEPDKMAVLFNDITARKKAELALKDSEKRYRTLFQLSNEGILLIKEVIVDCNEAACKILRCRREDIIGRDPEELSLPPSSDRGEDIGDTDSIWRAAAAGTPQYFRWRCRRKDGTIAELEVALKAVTLEGTPYLLGAGRDISDIQQAQQKAAESEERLKRFIENAPDAFFVHDMEGRIRQVNEQACQSLGYDRVELIGMSLMDIETAATVETARDVWNRIETEGAVSFEGVHKRKDGTLFPVEVRLSSIRLNHKDLVFGFARDVSERKAMEEEKQKVQNQLIQVQKREAIGTLAGGIAHDFNNLLTGILGRASLMAFDLDPTHPCQDHLKDIMTYTRSATDLTKQLLGLARGGKYEVLPTDVNEIVEESATMFGRTRKEVRLHTQFHRPSPVVEVDRRQIEQVLLNLYVNAWQAMPEGGELYLETSTARLDESYCRLYGAKPGHYGKISVTDTGTGMDAATQQRIFDPFFTTKEKSRGTGLGLASAYGIIKNHGGIITVYSEVGQGTTFNVYLPISDQAAQPKTVVQEDLVQGSASVLLVDDEQLIIDVGTAILEKLGYHVMVATGGEEALDAVRRRKEAIDLVILDMIMPGMDGGKTFDRLRAISPGMPVILSSGYALNGKAADIMQRGCNGFLQKPFNISELSRKVEEVLNAAHKPEQE
jgi:two-component system cell cycle sensor histidine kinase/response regulator CckA